MKQTFDMIVVGGGGSGLAAAARGAELGLSVLVLEREAELGGTTGIAVGSFTANRTRFQARAGIDDSLDAHVEDAGKFAPPEIEARNHHAMRRFFLSRAAETLDWLTGMGLAFHGPSPEPPNRAPRMHNVVPNAKAYIAALHARLLRHGGRVRCNARVVELVRESNASAPEGGGRVTGVVAECEGRRLEFSARLGVVLAAGDYAASGEWIGRFKGDRFRAVEGINPRAVGDGHRLAERAGALLLNMDITYGPELRFTPPRSRRGDFTQLLPASGPLARVCGWLLPLVPKWCVARWVKRLLVTWQHPEEALFEHGAILINQHGERFCDERAWPERELAVARQPAKAAYLLLDDRLARRFNEWPHFISTAPEIAYAHTDDYLRLRPDVATRADSLEQLAERRDLPAAALRETVRQVNRQRAEAGGHDSLPPLVDGPWVLLGPVKAYFTTTEGGAAINQRFEVLDQRGEPIAGLHAVGQNGLGGQVLFGHGLHIAWAITSGRLVAEHLAAVEPTSPSRARG